MTRIPLLRRLSAILPTLIAFGCGDSSNQTGKDVHDVGPVATKNCTSAHRDQCVALFGDPRVLHQPKAPSDLKAPQITSFVPKSYFGNAPFRTQITFAVQSLAEDDLACVFDAEGDGIFERSIACSAGSVSVEYPIPGRYAPALRVTDTAGRVSTASEFLFSNKLVLKPNTVVVDELPGLLGSKGSDGEVLLSFDAVNHIPSLSAGTILLDRSVNSYVRRVTSAAGSGTSLTVKTEELALYDAFESGFFGLRYPQLAYSPSKDAGGQSTSGPGAVPQDLPGDGNLGPFKTKLDVPVPSNVKLDLGNDTEVSLDNSELDIDLDIDLFEWSVLARYLFLVGGASIRFETDISVLASGALVDKSVFVPLGPLLGAGIDTPAGKMSAGAVLEIGLKVDAEASFGWHQKVSSNLAIDVRQTDPLTPDWAKALMGYPPDAASIWGPPPKFEISNPKFTGDIAAKVFAAPQLVLSFGNASGVMQRSKKSKAKYDAECEKFKGFRMAAGLELNVSAMASASVGPEGASLCFDGGADIKAFAEFFPGFKFCPSAEYSFVGEDIKNALHACWCYANVVKVIASSNNYVGKPLSFDVTGTCFKPSKTEGEINATLSGCKDLKVTNYTDTQVSYSCVPTAAGTLAGEVKSKDGGVSYPFSVKVLPNGSGGAGSGGAGGSSGGSGGMGGMGGGVSGSGGAGGFNEACCTPHNSVGCIDKAVADCVCAKDADCCKTQWDQSCVDEIKQFSCGSCSVPCQPQCNGKCSGPDSCGGTCPNTCGAGTTCGTDNETCEVAAQKGPCCEIGSGMGCNDMVVETCVCAKDAYCCNNQWDQTCVDEISSFGCGSCGACQPQCGGKCSGPDGCGKTCPNTCEAGATCNASNVCEKNCSSSNYWTPTSVSGLDIDGVYWKDGAQVGLNVGVRIEVSQSATTLGGLKVRVCKADNSLLQESFVHVYFKNSSGVVMFDGKLGKNGTSCSDYGEMSGESSFAEGNVFDGMWRMVSPFDSASMWTNTCLKAGGADPTGTCWTTGIGTMSRTCKL